MRKERLKPVNTPNLSTEASLSEKSRVHKQTSIDPENAVEPSNQLKGGLLGWYSVCSSVDLKKNELFFFSMFNEPLIIYRDKDSNAKCVKDLCPHRGASFQGGELLDGEIQCPYHGARFSSRGECTNLERITCQHIVDTNYNNYAKKIHLYQYPCIERNDYIFIYYTGQAKTDLNEFKISEKIETSLTESYGFNTNEYEYEEVNVDFKCDWSRILENHLDVLHIYWVHGDTIPDKDVSRNSISSFNQIITRDRNQIESKYNFKDKSKGEFITIKFVPPGRILIYKGSPDTAKYIQVLDHIPLSVNRARVIVRHYRRFLRNKYLTKLIMFKLLQKRIFYKIFSEDYLILKTQTFNNQMGYIEKDNVKLLGEDKMVQYYWDWLQNALKKDKPWEIHTIAPNTNSVHDEMEMLYPPENRKMEKENKKDILINLFLRAAVPIGIILLII